jgi:hypothetical protein
MKKLALIFLLIAAPLTAQISDRQILLRSDGVVHTVESVAAAECANVTTTSSRIIQLSTHDGDKEKTLFVPASLEGGLNSEPSLAYDSATRTLFVFWQRMPNRTSSELVFASYRNGEWSQATVLDPALFRFRSNLKIAVTRSVDDRSKPQTLARLHQLVIHAIWWEETGFGESGRYAMISLADGIVSDITLRNLSDFIPESTTTSTSGDYVSATVDRGIFRHPSIHEMPDNESVDIIFGDFQTNRFNRINVRVIRGEGVLNLPIGIVRGALPVPGGLIQIANNKLTTIAIPGTSNIAFYTATDRSLTYTVFKDLQWSEAKTISITERVTHDGAVGALRQLVASAER